MHPTQPKSKQGKLSTAPFSASKKSGMKRENPPCTPIREKQGEKKITPVLLARVYPRARTQARASASAHARRGDPPMQPRTDESPPEARCGGDQEGPAQGTPPSAGPPAHPQKRLKQGEINMRNHGKIEDTEKIIYHRAKNLYFRHRNELLALFKIGFSCG